MAGSEIAAREPTDVGAFIGVRLRRLRLMHRLTLHEAAAQAGISHSFLSMLERGKADVSVSRLGRLATLYGMRLSELLREEGHQGKPRLITEPDMLVVDRGPGIKYRFFQAGGQLGIQSIHVVFDPGAGFHNLLAHQGEDIGWVMRGELTLTYGGDEYVVRAGQAITYAATVPHAFRNHTPRPAELLAMTTPPYW